MILGTTELKKQLLACDSAGLFRMLKYGRLCSQDFNFINRHIQSTSYVLVENLIYFSNQDVSGKFSVYRNT